MNLFGRALKLTNWLLWGKDGYSRARVISFLEVFLKEGKNVELVANKKGELTIRYRKEF
jgi:hypothetical protein